MPPFDRDLPSPIARVLELQARAPGAVVALDGMTALQRDAFVPSAAEERLLALAASEPRPDLLVISGSAGSGKSALIDRLEGAQPGTFEFTIQDATHSDSPSDDQTGILRRFFEPFRDDAPGPPASPRVIAANIGLLLAFFSRLGESGDHPFHSLESILYRRLGIRDAAAPEVPWVAAVLNLDLRPTAGVGGLFADMLRLVDFENPAGIAGGAPRCATCEVKAWCPVRANAGLVSRYAEPIDALAAQAAAERGRHDAPRDLWDFAARLVCGDDSFAERDDPCDAVAEASARQDRPWVWEHLLPRKLFDVGGSVGSRIASLDPSMRPSLLAHRALASAGIRPSEDAEIIRALDPGGDGAAATAASYLEGTHGAPVPHGRALVAAQFLAEPAPWSIGDELAEEFGMLLAEYEVLSRGAEGEAFPAIEGLQRLLGRALGRSFGIFDGERPYIPVKAYDPRDPSRVFVDALLEYKEGIYQVIEDPLYARDPAGAELAAHRPLAVTVRIGGVESQISLPVYRLLKAAAKGTVASTADLERFYGLRRAVEALARTAAGREGRKLMVERPGTSRRYLVRETSGLTGRSVIAVEEVGQ